MNEAEEEHAEQVSDEAFDYLTVKEFARRRRCHPQTVYSAIRCGRFQFAIERTFGTSSIRIKVPRFHVER